MMPTSHPHFPEAFTEEELAFALITFILNGIFPGLAYSNHRIVTLPVGWYPVQRPRQTDDGQRGFRACRGVLRRALMERLMSDSRLP